MRDVPEGSDRHGNHSQASCSNRSCSSLRRQVPGSCRHHLLQRVSRRHRFCGDRLPQDSGRWLSRGWLELSQDDCAAFDTALRVSSFYYRGVSNPYRKNGRRVIETWGDDRKFAVWDDDNFQYYNAEERVLKSKLASFSLGAEKMGEGADVTVTFKDGGTTITVR